MPPSKRIAIVGGGISGIACSWTLRDWDCDVDIYDADERLGGHANSVPFTGNNRSVNVDTGFIAMDETTYPQFTSFLKELGVETIPTDMSFGVSAADGAIEWGSHSIKSFVGSLTLLFTSWFWRLVFDILRFSLFAEDILHEDSSEWGPQRLEKDNLDFSTAEPALESIGQYLQRQGYSEQFMTYFLIPMVAAPWCIDPDEFARTFPAKPLIKFMMNHQLLDTVATTLRWRSFRNGSKTYVDTFQRNLPARHSLHLNTKIMNVEQLENCASITFSDGTCETFDHVVLAIHANQALTLLGSGATDMQRTILGSFQTRRNICYLHSDTTLLPKRQSARVAWNCILNQQPKELTAVNTSASKSVTHNTCEDGSSKISITFDMNRLQDIPAPGEIGSPGRVLVTMNPIRAPRSPQSSQEYYHPIITSESILMLRHLNKINGVANVSFAGAWMGFGFHEDGFAAGAHAARTIMHGHEKTPALDITSRIETRTTRRKNSWLYMLKAGIHTIQQMLDLMGALYSEKRV